MKKINQYRKQIICLFGAIAMISYLSLTTIPKQENLTLTMVDLNHPMMQVYLPDKEATLIPISIPVEAELSLDEQLKTMVNYMNMDHEDGIFKKLFQKPTSLNKVVVNQGNVLLDFDHNFSSYKKSNELKVLEAIVWGATQFEAVQTVSLAMEGKLLSQMPVSKTPIASKMDRKLGINNFETANANLYDSQPMTVFYTKKIQGKQYYVPKTNRIGTSVSEMNDQVDMVLSDISVASGLEQPLFVDRIKQEKASYMDGSTLVVHLNQNILKEDRAAKQEAYETLVLSLSQLQGVEKVKVCVDDVVVSIHGSNEEAISVSSLSYNHIAF